MNQAEFLHLLKSRAETTNAALENYLTDNVQVGERLRPPRLMAAMRHGVLNGGKRLRPFLVTETACLFEVSPQSALPTACALELLHCYSLVHDDLPAMDDDDLRRGQPTVHRAYDEATAILAGDALLTMAFELLAEPQSHGDPSVRADLSLLLAKAAGLGGMIGGQMLDLAAETDELGEHAIRDLQAMKTGALIKFACEAGAVLGGASAEQRDKLVKYGEKIGLAFQLADDLLDVTSDAETMGKAVGKDADRGKGTLVGIYGVEKVEKLLDDLVADAVGCLSNFGQEADVLRQTAIFVAKRKN